MSAEWRGWTTDKEKDYLLEACQKRNTADQLDFLKKYLLASKNRVDWQEMDRNEVLAYVARLIDRIRKGRGLPIPIPGAEAEEEVA